MRYAKPELSLAFLTACETELHSVGVMQQPFLVLMSSVQCVGFIEVSIDFPQLHL